MTDDTRTPTTQAGRALLANLIAIGVDAPSWTAEAESCILAIEAEARDATGLREALDALYRPGYGAMTPHDLTGQPSAVNGVVKIIRAALAAAPQEPRWPSRDELAKAIQKADDFLTKGSDFNGHKGPDPIAAHITLDDALREGAER